MKKIDVHAHTTNRVLKHTMQPYANLKILEEEMAKYDIEKTVLLATYFPHRSSGVTNYRLLNWMQGNDKFVMFGSLDFEHYFFQGYNEMAELADAGKIKGVKVYTCYQNVDLHSDKFKQVVALASKHALPMMFHTGYSYSSKRNLGRPSVTDMVSAKNLEFLAKENPQMQFIFSHMSKPYFTEMEQVALKNENVYTDMSGLVDSRHNRDEIESSVEVVRHFVEHVGPRKLLFGTDFPVQTHEDSVYFVEKGMQGFSESDRQDVYYNNARRLIKW